MELQRISINDLHLTAINMRHGRKKPDVSDILPSIKERGVIVPLLVRPREGEAGFEIVAGRRRYYATKAAINGFGNDIELPCAIMAKGDDAAALENSILENVARLDPDEMSQYEAFLKLANAGRTVSEISDTFGVTELLVSKRLALANLLPKIRDGYRNGDISAGEIKHLTLATKAKQIEWLALYEDPEQFAPQGYRLKSWLFGGKEISTSVALFDPETYTGSIIADLFGEDEYFQDSETFWTLQNEAIATARDKFLAGGWSDVVVLDPTERFCSWEMTATSKAKGGRIYIDVSENGEVEIQKGFMPNKEIAQMEREAEAVARGEDVSAPGTVRPELTQSMESYLALQRHSAVRYELLDHSGVALRLMVAHALASFCGKWHVETEGRNSLRAFPDIFGDSKAESGFATEREWIIDLLDVDLNYVDAEKLFAKMLTVSDEDVNRVLVFVMANTLQVGSSFVEVLGNMFAVNMANYWKPDDTFFDLIRSKPVINGMLSHIGGKAVADANVASTGKVQKQVIRDFIDGSNDRVKAEGWLPHYLAFPFKGYTKANPTRFQSAWDGLKKLFKKSRTSEGDGSELCTARVFLP